MKLESLVTLWKSDKLQNFIWGLIYSSLGSKFTFLKSSIRHFLKYGFGCNLNPRELTVTLKGNTFSFKEFTGEIGMFYQIFVERIYDSSPGFANVGGHHGIILDVGASVGMFTVKAAGQNPDFKIYSFEPNPDVFQRLLQNIEYNDLSNVQAYNLGCSDKASIATINDKSSTVLGEIVFDDSGSGPRVELITLDSFIQEHGIEVIDLMKFDVEGFEYAVLQGVEKNIHRIRKIVMECDKKLEPKVIEHLASRGFSLVNRLPEFLILYFINESLLPE